MSVTAHITEKASSSRPSSLCQDEQEDEQTENVFIVFIMKSFSVSILAATKLVLWGKKPKGSVCWCWCYTNKFG